MIVVAKDYAHELIEVLVEQLSPRFHPHNFVELDIFIDRIVVAIMVYDKCKANSTSSREFLMFMEEHLSDSH